MTRFVEFFVQGGEKRGGTILHPFHKKWRFMSASHLHNGHTWRLSSSFFWSLWGFRHTPVKKFYLPEAISGWRRPLRLQQINNFDEHVPTQRVEATRIGTKYVCLKPKLMETYSKSKVPKCWQKEFWSQSFKDQIISEAFIQLQLFPKYYRLLPLEKKCV